MKNWSKNLKLTIISVVLILGMQSCCTKVHCVGADEIYEIYFHNFTPTDIDTILILSYEKNSNFTTLIDSSFTQADSRSDRFFAYVNNRINIDLDYKIRIFSTGQIFTLTDFEIKKEGCNDCFPYRPKSDFYNRLTCYSINGQKQSESQITIYK